MSCVQVHPLVLETAIVVITPPATLLAAVSSSPSPGESAKETATHECKCAQFRVVCRFNFLEYSSSFFFLLLSVPPSACICDHSERISCAPVVSVESFLCDFRDVLDHEVIARVIEMK